MDDWLNKARENHGWFFVGLNENMGVKNNEDCFSGHYGFRLEVKVKDE